VRAGWVDLLDRAAEPNAFMDPALVCVAGQVYRDAPARALLAWRGLGSERRLVGVWAFAVRRAQKSALPVHVLTVPPYAHGHLATPVVDGAYLDAVLEAMLDRVAADPDLPKILALDSMGTEGPTMVALARVLAERGSTPCVLEQFRRPKLASDLSGRAYLERALSTSTRKKLRQHRRKLATRGALETRIVTGPDAVRRALDEFLVMEASGWKARHGTALLASEADAAFMRAGVGALADEGCASIHALYLDERPVSMQVVVRAGRAAFTWKTAYDERFQEFSPGMLLLEDYTTAFLADASIGFVDSCAYDDTGFMSAWTERQAIGDLWIDARRGRPVAFRVLGRLQTAYRDLRAAAKTAHATFRRVRGR
jgi:hypothetical protein